MQQAATANIAAQMTKRAEELLQLLQIMPDISRNPADSTIRSAVAISIKPLFISRILPPVPFEVHPDADGAGDTKTKPDRKPEDDHAMTSPTLRILP
jgi:hypothetical protein